MRGFIRFKKGVTLVDVLLGIVIFSIAFLISVNSIKASYRLVSTMQNYVNIYAFMKEIGDSVMEIQNMDKITSSEIASICNQVKTTHQASKFLQSVVITPVVTMVKQQIKSPQGLQLKKIVIHFSWESAVSTATTRQLILFRSGLGTT